MAKFTDLQRLIAETIYANNDPFDRAGDRAPFGPDEHGILRGKSLVANIQARAVLEKLGLLDGAEQATSRNEYGTKDVQRFQDDYVSTDTMTTRKEVIENITRLPGSIAVKRRVVRIEGPWRAIEP